MTSLLLFQRGGLAVALVSLLGCGQIVDKANDDNLPKTNVRAAIDVLPTPLPTEVIAAWEAAGASVGWIRLDEQGFLAFPEFIDKDKGAPGDLPAFKFWDSKNGLPAKLPVPRAPFALSFSNTEFSDTHLNQLAYLTTLRALNLSSTPVTDAGLKELAKLPNLEWLSIVQPLFCKSGLGQEAVGGVV